MIDKPCFADVVFPLPVNCSYTYAVPREMSDHIRPGLRVLAPFSRHRKIGFVVSLSRIDPGRETKSLVSLLDSEPLLSSDLLELSRWVSDYYFCSWGEALRAALPGGISPREKSLVRLREPSIQDVIRRKAEACPDEARLLEVLASHREMEVRTLARKAGVSDPGFSLARLQGEGYIEIMRVASEAQVRVKEIQVVRLTTAGKLDDTALTSLGRRSPSQAALLSRLLTTAGAVERSTLPFEARVIRALEKKRLIQVLRQETSRESGRGADVGEPPDLILTPEQTQALEQIVAPLEGGEFKTFLLHGVTGSGKTEVYLRAMAEVLSRGRAGLVLVPEISLIPQTVSRFRSRFGDEVSVYHSSLSLGERYDAFRRIREGGSRVVIGVRSAVFAPLSNLGLIVVDEEQETSYKQSDSAPRYHARDVAVMRGKMSKAVVILGSATPSLESYENARKGKYRLEVLSSRIQSRPLPAVQMVDRRHQSSATAISELLREAMGRHLSRGGKVLLLLNRRGFSTFGQCADCGFTLRCPHCNIALVHHLGSTVRPGQRKIPPSVRCHYCGHTQAPPQICPQCRSHQFSYRGIGTQRLEQEVARLFPQQRVERMDRDTTQKKGAHWDILERFQAHESGILLGTQMIAKGLDIPEITLVGVISADTGLNLPDFRCGERTFQMLAQVAGRAGRGEMGGEVLIQTYDPFHFALAAACEHDYARLFDHEIKERRELHYPPFSHLILILFEARSEEDAPRAAESLRSMLEREMKKGGHAGGGDSGSGPRTSRPPPGSSPVAVAPAVPTEEGNG